MGTNWQQLGPVHAKVVGDKTLVTVTWGCERWGIIETTATSYHCLFATHVYATEAEAMAAADAIYDPPAKKIEAADRGPNHSYWKSEDGQRSAWVCRGVRRWFMETTDIEISDEFDDQASAEAAAAKYVGGEGS